MRRRIAGLALVVVALGMAACSRPVAEIPQPADWATVPEPARAPMREAIERSRNAPGDPEAMAELGRTYHGNEQIELAAACYERALVLGSTDAAVDYLLGLIRRQHGQSARAIERFGRAAAREPSYGPAQHNLALALLDAGRADEAVEAGREAVRRDPDNASFHAGLGRALRQAVRLDEAEAALRRALELDPDDPEAHQLLGLTLLALDRADEAEAHLDRRGASVNRVVSDPWLLEAQRRAATPRILLDRANGLLAVGRVDSALRALDEAAAAYPDNAAIQRMLGKARMQAGHRQEAVDAYLRAVQLQPDEPEAHAALAMILTQHGNAADAEREADLALAADPGHALAGVLKANLEIRNGRPEAALAILRPLLERRDDLPPAHVVLGEALTGLARFDAAAVAFARAVELDPRTEYAHRRLGQTYLQLGRRQDARRELEIAAGIEPANETTRRLLDELLREEGE